MCYVSLWPHSGCSQVSSILTTKECSFLSCFPRRCLLTVSSSLYVHYSYHFILLLISCLASEAVIRRTMAFASGVRGWWKDEILWAMLLIGDRKESETVTFRMNGSTSYARHASVRMHIIIHIPLLVKIKCIWLVKHLLQLSQRLW